MIRFEFRYAHRFVHRLTVARTELAVRLVIGKKVAVDQTPVESQRQDVLQCDEINPHGIGLVGRPVGDVVVEPGEKLPVETFERQVGTSVVRADASCEMHADAPIFIMRALRPVAPTMRPNSPLCDRKKRTIPSRGCSLPR